MEVVDDINTKPVGRVVATEKNPNTAQSFNFWTNLDSPVGIGTIVKVVDNREREVYGIVTEGISYTDIAAPMQDYISSECNPEISINVQTERPEIRYYTASVLKMVPEEPIQPVSIGNVYLADDEAVKKSLRMDKYADESGIPVGLYVNGDSQSPVYLDSKFLIGPEAAHLNVTGVSGLATKTSIIEFLISSIFQHYKEDGGIATVLFNVKGYDLLFLDQVAENLSEDEKDMYKKLNMEIKPFENVEYFAPYKNDGYNLNTKRTHTDLSYNVKPLRWGLKEIFDHVEVLLNKDDIDAKADAFLSFIKENIIEVDKIDPQYGGKFRVTQVLNFNDLKSWFNSVFKECEDYQTEDDNFSSNGSGKSQWRSHAIPTMRKVYNRLMNLTARCEGLLSNDSSSSDLFDAPLEDQHVYVVDVANVSALAQDLIFTRTVEKLKEQLENKELGVEKVIVFVDELNKYASSDSGNSYLKQTLLEISERGRYLGLILFSAQQFKSQVHKRIVGNCGTSIYGRMDMDELATPGYSVMPSTIKAELTVLEKGKLLIRHPHFNQYIFVKFPRPAVMPSQEGSKKFPPSPDKPFEEAMIYNFKRLDSSIKSGDVKDAIAGVPETEVMRAFYATEQSRVDDPLVYFKNILKKKPTRESFEGKISITPGNSDVYKNLFGNCNEI